MPHLYIRCPNPSEFEDGFARLRSDFSVPESFPDDVLTEAAAASERYDDAERRDRRDIEFVAIDPAGSADLDQVYHASITETGYRVHYGIADVARFVEPGSILDAETHARGLTLYAPDRRAPLHPEILSEDNASLLANADRPAILWTLDLDERGQLVDVSANRATVRNREQLCYQEAQRRIDEGSGSESLMLLRELGLLRRSLAVDRGAVSLNLPGQELAGSDGEYTLRFDEVLPVEEWNAEISLLTGMAAAELMIDAKVGLVRTLPAPGRKTLTTLRNHSRALGVPFADDLDYGPWVSSLDPTLPTHVALMTQATQGLRGAGYQSFDGTIPEASEHAAIAADYTHVTAPLRRLVDRFTGEIAVALSRGKRPPDWVLQALPELPKTMQNARSRKSRYERAILDFAEALVLSSRVGQTFQAFVVDVGADGATIQLTEPAVVAHLEADGLALGQTIDVRLEAADIYARRLTFSTI